MQILMFIKLRKNHREFSCFFSQIAFNRCIYCRLLISYILLFHFGYRAKKAALFFNNEKILHKIYPSLLSFHVKIVF